MRGLIMDRPLLISDLLRHADANSGEREIVTRTVEGPIHRYTYTDAHIRARQLATALVALDVKLGDRIAPWPGTPPDTSRSTTPSRALVRSPTR